MVNLKITKIKARQVLDSRGNPTIETDVYAGKIKASAIVPSGASTGRYEAYELRDNEKAYHGKSVLKAVKNVNEIISKKIIGMNVVKQKEIDETMINLDGTENKNNLGANAILSVSLAAARCGAEITNKSLYSYLGKSNIIPIPFCNIINGGKHSNNELKIQEFMIVPTGAKSFSEAVQMVSETCHTLKQNLELKYGKSSISTGDEGGFSPLINNPKEALEIIEKSINDSGYKSKIKIALDCASSEYYDNINYKIEEGKLVNSSKLIDYYLDLIKNYQIISIEDPFDQDDFNAYKEFKKKTKIQVVGDDLLVTNTSRIELAAKEKLCNCLLLKVNQIGTLTESLNAANLAYKNKWNVMVSHRSGETEDTFIADLAVSLGCGQIKIGAPNRGERTCKFNRLLRIEEELGKKAKYSKF